MSTAVLPGAINLTSILTETSIIGPTAIARSFDALGLVGLTSIYVGTPVVSWDVPPINEFLNNGADLILVKSKFTQETSDYSPSVIGKPRVPSEPSSGSVWTSKALRNRQSRIETHNIETAWIDRLVRDIADTIAAGSVDAPVQPYYTVQFPGDPTQPFKVSVTYPLTFTVTITREICDGDMVWCYSVLPGMLDDDKLAIVCDRYATPIKFKLVDSSAAAQQQPLLRTVPKRVICID